MNIEELARENIRNLTPYRSARDDFSEGMLLDANENSYGSPVNAGKELHRYPDPHQKKLRSRIAEFRGISAGQIFTGVGSDEAIDLLIRIFCRPGKDNIMICPPTYGMYGVSAAVNNAGIKKVRLDSSFDIRPEKILNETDEHTKLLFLCSPNNPTGNCLSEDKIKQVLKNFAGLVIIDEAYIDFADTPGYVRFLDDYPNLVVTQTLSKAFGLAGIRLGIALANTQVINLMMKVKAPYNINKLTAEAALEGLAYPHETKNIIKQIVQERSALAKALETLDCTEAVYPSDANFLLVKMKDAYTKYKKLAEMGVIVRYRGNEPGCEDCLRITIGTPEENQKLLKALNTIDV